MKICKFCGKEFQPNSNRQQYCKGPHIRICPVCGKEYTEDNVENLKRPPVACSYECRVKKTQATSISKYGCKAPGNNKEAREKAKQTMINNLGVEYAMQSPAVREKSRRTWQDRAGVDNPANLQYIVDKRMKTNRELYGETMPFNRPECYEKQHQTMMDRYSVPFGCMTPNAVANCGHITKTNLHFRDLLIEQGCNEVELEKRIETKQYDLFIPSNNTVIEINPSYTHSVVGNHWNKEGLDKYYHRDKTELARRNGFKCINIWDWDDVNTAARILAPRVDVDVSEMEVFRLNPAIADEFLLSNHFSGTRRNQLLYLGLVKDDELYQVMTFGKPTHRSDHAIQLCRMCTKTGFNVIGGYDILSKAASEFGLYNIIAYADLSKTDGSEYLDIGMEFIRQTQPRLIWSKGDKYISSSLITSGKSQFHSNEELIENGWLPVYDCGQRVYEFK